MFVLVRIFMMTYFLWLASANSNLEGLREEFPKLLPYWHDICRDVTEATEENIRTVKSGNFIDDPNVQKYLYCIWRISGAMGTDFEFNFEVLDQYIPERRHDTVVALVKKCHKEAKNRTDLPIYKKTYILQQCLFEGDPVDFIQY